MSRGVPTPLDLKKILWYIIKSSYIPRSIKVEIDKTAINAAMQALIEDPSDKDAAAVIIEFGDTLPNTESVSYESVSSKRNKGSFTGHTREQGNVSLENGQQKETKEFQIGMEFERVGFFKIYRRWNRIIFHNFWKSDLIAKATDKMPPVYSVQYNPETMEYLDFCVRINRKTFRFGGWWLKGFTFTFVRVFWKSLITGEETYSARGIMFTNRRIL